MNKEFLNEMYKQSKFKSRKEFNEWLVRIVRYAVECSLEVGS